MIYSSQICKKEGDLDQSNYLLAKEFRLKKV
jgi:hypothetical protein